MVESIERIIAAIEHVRGQAKTAPRVGPDLVRAADQVLSAAQNAQRRVRAMASPFSIPRLRLYLLVICAVGAATWMYRQRTQLQNVRVAIADADAALLETRVERHGSDNVKLRKVAGSNEGLRLLFHGAVDATVVQGGVSLDDAPLSRDRFDRLGLVRHEHVLFMHSTKDESTQAWAAGDPKRVLTLGKNQGSHQLAKVFFDHWEIDVTYVHEWPELCAGTDPQVDGIFAVLDLSDRHARSCLLQAVRLGYTLTRPDLGAFEEHLDYLSRRTVRPGYFHDDPPIPQQPLETYWVDNYLLARRSLSPDQRADLITALAISRNQRPLSESHLTRLTHSSGNSLVADLADLFEAVVNCALVIAFFLGLEILLQRSYIQELSVLLTRLSLLQADRDVLGVADPEERAQNVVYLELCGDLLGLVSSIAGYYSHANAALAFNGLTGLVHVRSNLLKLNIQLKLVQASNLQPSAASATGGVSPGSD